MLRQHFLLRLVLLCSLIQPEASHAIPKFCRKGFELLGLSKTEKVEAQEKNSRIPDPTQPPQFKSDHERDMYAAAARKKMKGTEKEKALQDYLKTNEVSKWFPLAVAANWATIGYMAVKAGLGFYENPQHLWWAAPAVAAGWYFADVGSQIFHKWLDSFASDRHWLWGPMTRAFRIHHEFASDITKHNYTNTVGPVAMGVAVPMAGIAAFLGNPLALLGTSVFHTGMLNLTEAHKQSHMKKPDPIWGVLQKMRLSITKEQHKIHHQPPYDEEFSVLNNWASPFFRLTDFWRKSDKLYWKIFKKMPTNWLGDPRSIPEDVVAQLKADLDKFPTEIFAVAEGMPNRIPAHLKPYVDAASMKYRNEYIQARHDWFKLMATLKDREKAEKDWKEEQEDPKNQWLYRGLVRDLKIENEGSAGGY